MAEIIKKGFIPYLEGERLPAVVEADDNDIVQTGVPVGRKPHIVIIRAFEHQLLCVVWLTSVRVLKRDIKIYETLHTLSELHPGKFTLSSDNEIRHTVDYYLFGNDVTPKDCGKLLDREVSVIAQTYPFLTECFGDYDNEPKGRIGFTSNGRGSDEKAST
jgi:hypothetical protein